MEIYPYSMLDFLRETRVTIPPEHIDKVAEMFRGTSFSEAVQKCALFGIEQLYIAQVEEQERKQKEKKP